MPLPDDLVRIHADVVEQLVELELRQPGTVWSRIPWVDWLDNFGDLGVAKQNLRAALDATALHLIASGRYAHDTGPNQLANLRDGVLAVLVGATLEQRGYQIRGYGTSGLGQASGQVEYGADSLSTPELLAVAERLGLDVSSSEG